MNDIAPRRPTLQHRLEYSAVAAIRAAIRVLPMGAVIAMGTVLGRLFHALDGPHRRLALRNLEAAFPAMRPKSSQGSGPKVKRRGWARPT